MYKFSLILLFLLLFNNNLQSKHINIYETSFYHVNVPTINTSQTKIKQIEIIKKRSFNNIIDKILTAEDKKIFLKNFNYSQYFDKIILNIIIENELITSEKYIADIKINFDTKEIIQILRNNNINYSDIISQDFLLISSYAEDFMNIGLSNKNIFYENISKFYSKNNKNLFNFILPELNPNDRFIIPYKKIVNYNKKALNKIANKYNVNQIIIVELYKIDNKIIEVTFNYFDIINNVVIFIDNQKFINDDNFYKNIFEFLNNWWKSENIIDNNISSINCQILSSNYDNLIYIKSGINKITQIHSQYINSIKLNNNYEEIKYYGDFLLLKKSLSLLNINISNIDNECIIKSDNK